MGELSMNHYSKRQDAVAFCGKPRLTSTLWFAFRDKNGKFNLKRYWNRAQKICEKRSPLKVQNRKSAQTHVNFFACIDISRLIFYRSGFPEEKK